MRLLSLRPTSPGLLAQPQLAGGESDGDVDDYVFLAAPRSWLCLDYGQRLLALQSRRERRGLADLPPLVVRPGLAARALEPHGLFAPETLEMTLV